MVNKLNWFIKLSVADIENEMLMRMGQNGMVLFDKVQYKEGWVGQTYESKGNNFKYCWVISCLSIAIKYARYVILKMFT